MTLRRHLNHVKGRNRDEEGIAVLIALIALSIFALLGLSLVLNSTTEVRISDNYESQVQASNAALAGLHHGRELLRGLQFNDLLVGPDGAAESSTTYLTQAHAHSFRNPVAWTAGRSLNILDPSSSLSSYSDD
jgi:Tfp pilus assembly protein PilX